MNTGSDQILLQKFLDSDPQGFLLRVEKEPSQSVHNLISSLDIQLSAKIISGLSSFKAGRVLEKADHELKVQLLNRVELSTAEVLIRQMDLSARETLIAALEKGRSRYLENRLKYKPDSVGAWVDYSSPILREDIVVSDAIQILKEHIEEVTSVVFVTNQSQRLIGMIHMKSLVVAKPEALIKSITEDVWMKVRPDMSVSELLNQWESHWISLPVVSVDETLQGSVSRRAFEQFRNETIKGHKDRHAVSAGNALGDLYLIGLSSLFGKSDSI